MPRVDSYHLVKEFMVGAKVFCCSDYREQFLASSALTFSPATPQPAFYELVNLYFVIEGYPMIFNMMNCKQSYMHHMDFKYSTIDTTFDKS